jgi:esterase/lipase superfamily enzyme
LTRALAEISKSGKRLAGQVRELVLAAPDIDATVFKEQIAPFLTSAAQGITLYVSDNDKALMASEKGVVSPNRRKFRHEKLELIQYAFHQPTAESISVIHVRPGQPLRVQLSQL